MSEKKALTQEQIMLLKSPLPSEAVKPHPTKSYLSSIKAIYVVERLNDVFGIGKWRLTSEIVDNKTSMIVVKSKLSIPDYDIELESYGGNDNGGENSKNFDLGDAYKGATTDALTKICSFLEIGIAVFKGQKTQPPKPEQPKQKPEMHPNHKHWNAVKEKLSTGVLMEVVEQNYYISDKNKELLISK